MKIVLSREEVSQVQQIIKEIGRKEVTRQWNAICKGKDHCSVVADGDQFIFDLNDDLSRGIFEALCLNAKDIGKVNKSNAIICVPKIVMSMYKIIESYL